MVRCLGDRHSCLQLRRVGENHSMPRLATARMPAEPDSGEQVARRAHVLQVAAELGATKGLEHTQMSELARRADVALATLYRYFPSKNHLFAALLTDRVQRTPQPEPDFGDPADTVAEFVTTACLGMLRRPKLARAMLTSVGIVRAERGDKADTTFRDMIIGVAQLPEVTDDDLRLARLVQQCAFAVSTWAAAGACTADEAEADIRTACRLLLAPWSHQRSG